ncbi:MAG: phosphoribosylanthranilate isomerase [Candidatus Symbiothrix sp.]|nr:phosphoribosylanthranilate isomerase [Candidatus Symbiothrix sp.]
MKIKVCGMRDADNILAVSQLPIDFMGFIFYKQSPRYDKNLNVEAVKAIPVTIQKVGIFVNATQAEILDAVETFDLQMVQLHGNESPEFCNTLVGAYCIRPINNVCPTKIIKAFQIASTDDFKRCAEYESVCDYFLFDTKTPQFGGSGKKFDWSILSAYNGKTPFFLSGGIAPEDAEAIKQLNLPQLFAIDLNSRFEVEPGVKDIEKLKQFIKPAPNPLKGALMSPLRGI